MTLNIDTLPNGMRVLTEHMPGLASASLGVWVMAGGRHEDAGENGIAHFLEHMAFKGTARRTALQIAEEIEDVGGYLNAYTSREMTAYYARVLAADVGLALDMIGDILLNPLYAGEEILVERGVILQEIGQALDTPDDVIFDWLQEAAYPDQPLGRSILGPAERVRSFGQDDLRRFTGAHYAPERIILVAAGAVDHDRVMRQAEEIFSAVAPRHAPSTAPGAFAGGEVRNVKTLEQAHFALAFEGPSYGDADFHAGLVFSTAFGGGMSSRLFQEAREKRGLCYSIFSQSSGYSDTGLMTIYAGTGAEEVRGLAELVADELRRAAGDMSDVEIARAKAQMRAGLLMGLESPFGRCERMARAMAIFGRVQSVEEMVAEIDAVDVAAARAMAERMAGAGKAALALYGPVGDAPDLATLTRRLAA
jgi:predicted Zn-dependent peptidase